MPRIYSNTALEALADCPRQGVTVINQPYRWEKTGPSRQGQAAHAALEQHTRHLFAERLLGDAEHGEKVARRVCSVLGASDREGILADLMTYLAGDFPFLLGARDPVWETRHHFTVLPTSAPTIVPVERVPNIAEPLFAMTADLTWFDGDDVLHVLDWKSGRIPEHISEPSENRQLMRYASALGLALRAESVQAHVAHVRHGFIEDGPVWSDFELREMWQEHVVEPIRWWESTIEHAASHPVVGPHCRDCDMRHTCDAYVFMPPDIDLGGTDEGLVTLTAIIEQKAKDARAALRARLGDGDGEVAVGDFTAKLSVTPQLVFDPVKVRAKLEEVLPAECVEVAFRVGKTSLTDAMRAAKMKPAARAELLEELMADATVGGTKTEAKIARKRKPRKKLEVEDEPGA